MSISHLPVKDGTPNGKAYALAWADDGTPYTYRPRRPGSPPQREFDLRQAISIADYMATYERTVLLVTDPETGTVLWTGEMLTR